MIQRLQHELSETRYKLRTAENDLESARERYDRLSKQAAVISTKIDEYTVNKWNK